MVQKIVYPALMEFEGDQVGVSFPDLPGCVTVGGNVIEAIENAREALLFHLEGMLEDGEKFPAASDIKVLKAKAGEVLVFVDVVSPEKVERVNITIAASDLARIDANATKAGMNRSAYMVRSALYDGFIEGKKIHTTDRLVLRDTRTGEIKTLKASGLKRRPHKVMTKKK